jgi:hypothetical protein
MILSASRLKATIEYILFPDREVWHKINLRQKNGILDAANKFNVIINVFGKTYDATGVDF